MIYLFSVAAGLVGGFAAVLLLSGPADAERASRAAGR
jgi:hypothetical protein